MKYRISADAIDCPLGDGLAIFKPDTATCFNLNRSGALLWDSARQPVGIDALCARLSAAYATETHDFTPEVLKLVDELVAAGLFHAIPDYGESAEEA